jgi:hypothetical protein
VDDFLPGSGVASYTAADQHRDYLDILQMELPRQTAVSYQPSVFTKISVIPNRPKAR